MKTLRLIIGTILVVASLLKLAVIGGLFHISWLERISEDPWTTWAVPLILICVGTDLIYHSLKN